MPLFWRTHLQVTRIDGLSRMMAQTTRTRARMCLFGFFSHCTPFRGSKTPKIFWGVNIRFQAKLVKSKKRAYYQNYCIDSNQILHSETTKCPSWVVPTHALQIQDGGRPPSWKNRKIVIGNLSSGSSDFDEIWHADAIRPSWPFRPLKIWNFKNPRWRRPPS